jgi:hypothetical protein
MFNIYSQNCFEMWDGLGNDLGIASSSPQTTPPEVLKKDCDFKSYFASFLVSAASSIVAGCILWYVLNIH